MAKRRKIIVKPKTEEQPPPKIKIKASSPGEKPGNPIFTFRRKRKLYILLLLLAVLVISSVAIFKITGKNEETSEDQEQLAELPPPSKKGHLFFGFDLSEFSVETIVFGRDVPMDSFLNSLNFSSEVAGVLYREAKFLEIRQIDRGNTLYILSSRHNLPESTILICELNDSEYGIFKEHPLPAVEIMELEIRRQVVGKGAIIKTDLWDAFLDNEIHYDLLPQVEDALKYEFDLYHLNIGDRLKVIYEEKLADDRVIGVGLLKAIYFESRDDAFEAYWLEEVDRPGYYTSSGNPVRKAFLMSPVNYGRISSSYNPKRIHPVLGKRMPHLGTDYAAPRGAPIFAVADGMVIQARFKENNGNYVKIKHDAVYQTQYLHMDRFAPGIKRGVHVKQGQVIGYVGSTGLATGPHVCFRFWKNGKQLDHLKEKITQSHTMSVAGKDHFIQVRDSMSRKWEKIPYFSLGG